MRSWEILGLWNLSQVKVERREDEMKVCQEKKELAWIVILGIAGSH